MLIEQREQEAPMPNLTKRDLLSAAGTPHNSPLTQQAKAVASSGPWCETELFTCWPWRQGQTGKQPAGEIARWKITYRHAFAICLNRLRGSRRLPIGGNRIEKWPSRQFSNVLRESVALNDLRRRTGIEATTAQSQNLSCSLARCAKSNGLPLSCKAGAYN